MTSRPSKTDLAAVGVDQADRHPEAGRLARPVGAEQADDLALVDLEIDPVDHLAAPIPLLQAADFEQGHGRSSLIAPRRALLRAVSSIASGDQRIHFIRSR